MSDLNVVVPDSGAAPTPTAPPVPASPALAPPVATSQVPATPPIAGVPEDRSNWVPPHRLREVRETSQRQFAEKEAAYQAELNRYQNQLRALVGVTPPPNQEHGAIRQQFDQVFGEGASSLFEKREQIEQYLERMQSVEAAMDHIWQSHAQQSMDRVFSHAEETLGSPVSPEGKRALHAAFTGWVQSYPEHEARYNRNDPTLVDEFWQALSSTLVDPARRTAAAGVAARGPQALPQDTPAGVPSPGPAPKPANLDERSTNAWAMYQTSANKNIR